MVSFSVVLDKTNKKQYVFSSRHLGAKKTILVGLSAQLVELIWYGVSTAEWGVWAAGMVMIVMTMIMMMMLMMMMMMMMMYVL